MASLYSKRWPIELWLIRGKLIESAFIAAKNTVLVTYTDKVRMLDEANSHITVRPKYIHGIMLSTLWYVVFCTKCV